MAVTTIGAVFNALKGKANYDRFTRFDRPDEATNYSIVYDEAEKNALRGIRENLHTETEGSWYSGQEREKAPGRVPALLSTRPEPIVFQDTLKPVTEKNLLR